MSNSNPVFKINERAFQQTVIQIAKWEGWRVHHTRNVEIRPGRWATPIQGDAGFPDLVLAHPKRGVIYAELKSAVGRVSEAQRRWLDTLEQAGAEAYVWRPIDIQFIRTRLMKGPTQ